ncbi:MAG: tyrosine-type recombinase/integrase [Bacteroides sp.]
MLKSTAYGALTDFSVGEVFQRTQNKVYAYKVTLFFQKKTVVQQKGGFKTKREACTARDVSVAELYSGEYVCHEKQTTVKDFLCFWLEEDVRLGRKLRIATYNNYKSYVEKHICPALGAIKLNALTQADVIHWLKNIPPHKYNRTTIRGVLSVLHNALKYAKKEGYVASVVTNGIRLPKELVVQNELNQRGMLVIDATKTLTGEQAIVLLTAAKRTERFLFILLALTLGLRKGEIRGLKYSDFNQFNQTVTIQRQLTKFKIGDAPLKTKSSYRVECVPSFVMDEITNERCIYEENRRKYSDFRDDDYVCCSEKGIPRSDGYVFKTFKMLLAENNLPDIRFHDLRHTYATILSNNNASSKAISKSLGHATVQVTSAVYIEPSSVIVRESKVIDDLIDEVTSDPQKFPLDVIGNDIVNDLLETKEETAVIEYALAIDDYFK